MYLRRVTIVAATVGLSGASFPTLAQEDYPAGWEDLPDEQREAAKERMRDKRSN